MNKIKQTGNSEPLPVSGSGCGIKPSKEALDKGYGVDFPKAKALLETENKTDSNKEKP